MTTQVNSRTLRTITIAKPLAGREEFVNRDDPTKATAEGWIENKTLTDKLHNPKLWRVHDSLYDLESYIDSHPGGSVFLTSTQGHDITEAFEAHHIRSIANEVLKKYKVTVKDDLLKSSNPSRHTYYGAWQKIKARTKKHLEEIGNPTGTTPDSTGLIHTTVVLQFLLASFLAAKYHSYSLANLAGFFMIGMWGVGHSQMHRSRNLGKWAFLRYAIDFTGFSHHDQTITHAISHHLFPNQFSDIEVFSSNVIGLHWLTGEEKKGLKYNPLMFFFLSAVTPLSHLIKRFVDRMKQVRGLLKSDVLIPLGFLLGLCSVAKSLKIGLKLALRMILVSGICFVPVGLSVHHAYDSLQGKPLKWHEGEYGAQSDFALQQIISTADHSTKLGRYLSATLFACLNLHTIHHLFPTLDISLHKDILDLLLRENTGGFADCYNNAEFGGGEKSFLFDLFPGIYRHAFERDWKKV